MKFITLGSSSLANGYLLTNGKEALVIECGVKIMEIKKHLDFDVSIINAAVVTHRHLDHSKHIKGYLNAAIDVYALKETFGDIEHNRAKVVQPQKLYTAGRFKILPFHVEHDVPCVGFLIRHPETGTIVFITDTYKVDYVFSGLTHILIEANYSDDIVQRNIESGRLQPIVRDRVFSSHIELQTCKQILLNNDLTKVQNIVLVHLSDGNSDAKRFEQEISAATGKPVYIADKHLILDFTKN